MEKKITIRVTLEEYEIIKANAQSVNRSLTTYIKELALNRVVINYNYKAIMEHTEAINSLKSMISNVLNNLLKTRTVYPADIEYIAYLLKEVTEGEGKMLRETEKERNEMRHLLKMIGRSRYGSGKNL